MFLRCKGWTYIRQRKSKTNCPLSLVSDSGYFLDKSLLFLCCACPTHAILLAHLEENLIITSVDDKKNYDLSLYPIPRADSVPDELHEIVDNPIFEAEELTLEAVYCRAYKVDDAGDTDGWRMRFSVKYGDVIVSISTKGVEPEWVYQQLVNLIPE